MQYEYDKICVHSKALICTVFSCTGLADARFLIGSKKVWDTQIYLVKTLSYTFFFILLPSPYLVIQVARILSYISFFIHPKNVHLKALM